MKYLAFLDWQSRYIYSFACTRYCHVFRDPPHHVIYINRMSLERNNVNLTMSIEGDYYNVHTGLFSPEEISINDYCNCWIVHVDINYVMAACTGIIAEKFWLFERMLPSRRYWPYPIYFSATPEVDFGMSYLYRVDVFDWRPLCRLVLTRVWVSQPLNQSWDVNSLFIMRFDTT